MVQIDFACKDENIVLASFTTAHARLCLYVLHKLGKSVLYFDTDSVIYLLPDGRDVVPTGDYLEDLTDELNGNHIVEFVSAGPKNYSYKLDNGLCHCKVKGFTLNHQASKKLNFEKLYEEVFLWHFNKSTTNTIISTSNRIRRNPLNQSIFNKHENKKYRVVYTKRVVMDNFDTKPYGY